ncbi:MAG: response regulator [Verrucomicrobia bacterium]|nr:response regulator [Verrucomicrobiota bacterium]
MKRILIVDDEPNVRLNYRITLELEGYQVDETGLSTEALKKAKVDKFDLVILDMRMPRMGGLDLLAALRAQRVTTPAIIITAFSDVPNAVRAIQLGASDFLQKPLRPEDLRRVVQEVLARNDQSGKKPEQADFERSANEARRLMQLGDLGAAKGHVLHAIELNTNSPDSFNLAGELAEQTGDIERARTLFEAALKLDGNNVAAREGLRRVFQALHPSNPDRPVETHRNQANRVD